MKREDLKAKGMTDEHIDFVLDEFHKEQEGLKGQIQTLTTERDSARDEVKKYQQGGELRSFFFANFLKFCFRIGFYSAFQTDFFRISMTY